ncbi:MAG: hypothetical protein LBN18_00350 [Dysgonamonadaceae bacterium]|jgi:hypothetical protein|nr:hypothetical protein [Dysgonamonadaceae bacterium]
MISYKPFILPVLLLLNLSLAAQERSFYQQMIKESIDMNMLLDPVKPGVSNDSASGVIELNVNKKPLAMMGYNFRQNSLFLHYKDSLPLEKQWTISPALTAAYTNTQEFNPNATETTGDVLGNVILTPLAGLLNPNPLLIFNYLMRIGILSDEPFVPREKKKEKALREITECIYPIQE